MNRVVQNTDYMPGKFGFRHLASAVVFSITIAAIPCIAAQSGNIAPLAIEIDVGANGANLYPDSGPDWVNGTTWRGVRILDGIASADEDIFLTGGKENIVSTWNVGPGSVGSSKYDVTQAYLANNQTHVFFGMERRGNNGTTAFDFEFNKLPPTGDYLPNRSEGDVLIAFEMTSSGGGAAPAFLFTWSDALDQWVGGALGGAAVASINNIAIPSGPWGSFDKFGEPATELDRFQFAEASVLLSAAFPEFNACNAAYYVQVRTRSSVSDTSDLKDTTKIFQYVFAGPTPATPVLVPDCFASFTYDATGGADSSGGNNIGYLWTFDVPPGVTLSGNVALGGDALYHSSTKSGTITVSGFTGANPVVVGAMVQVTETGTTCSAETEDPGLVTVYPILTAAITGKTPAHDLTVTLTGSAPGANGFQWQKKSGASWVNISGATSSTLVYSNFEVDGTASDYTSLPWKGRRWDVEIRLHATRADGCAADSPGVPLSKITAVDP